MNVRTVLILLLVLGCGGCGKQAAQVPSPPVQPTEKLPPEVVGDPESAMQKYKAAGKFK